jgi:phosphoglycolate phosphatase-like HAD superfamily hydrolase
LRSQSGQPDDEFIKSLYTGDVGNGNIIKQIFQEIYLGEELFRETYNLIPSVYRGEGLILKERVLIESQVLEELSQNNMLAIATGRPRSEADYPLTHFKLRRFFSAILTLDDCLEEEERILAQEGHSVSLSKPNPFMLDAVTKSCKRSFSGLFYVGDMPDDMLAARRSEAGFKGIGLVISAPDKQSLSRDLERAGADYVIDNFDALKEIVL